MIRILTANERFSYLDRGYNPATHNGGNSAELCLYIETNTDSSNYGKVFKHHNSDDGRVVVYTKASFEKLAEFWRNEMRGHARFYVSDLGYLLIPSSLYDDGDYSNKTAIAKFETPLTWDHPDDMDSDMIDRDIGKPYYGILYGTAYVLSQRMGHIRFSQYGENRISTKSPVGENIKEGARQSGRTMGGKIYVKDNGVIWGVLGTALNVEAPIYLGKLKKSGTGWVDWF
jgi:hypothetical protein